MYNYLLDDIPELERIVLEYVKVQVRAQLSQQDLLMANEPHVFIQKHIDRMVMDIAYTLAGVRAQKTFELSVNYPKTWWQAFKLQYFPKWLLKLTPVEYATIKQDIGVHASALFPSLPIIPEHSPVFMMDIKKGPTLKE